MLDVRVKRDNMAARKAKNKPSPERFPDNAKVRQGETQLAGYGGLARKKSAIMWNICDSNPLVLIKCGNLQLADKTLEDR